jgi:hypothetical protein
VPELLAYVERAGLVFAGWGDNSWYYPDRWVPPEHPLRKMLERIPERDQWAVIENLMLTMWKHFFYVCRPERRFVGVNFSGEGWLGYVPVLHPVASASGQGGSAKIVCRGFETPVTGLDTFFLSQTSAKRTIREMIADPRVASTAEVVRINGANDFFSRMWRLGLMFFPTVA